MQLLVGEPLVYLPSNSINWSKVLYESLIQCMQLLVVSPN